MSTDRIDPRQCVDLWDVGAPDYQAATVIDINGNTAMILAHRPSIGDATAIYHPDCSEIEHEQLGPLPIETLKRITIARRRHTERKPNE